MAAIPLAFNTWAPIPVTGSAGTVTVVNPSTAPIYVYVFAAGVHTTGVKVAAGASAPLVFPAGSTVQANACKACTTTVG